MERVHQAINKSLQEHHEWIKGKLREIAEKDTHPHDVAIAFSIGLFIALATPGIDLLLALLVGYLLRLHKIALVFGVALINPLTTAFIYPLSFKLGQYVVRYESVEGTAFFSLETLRNIGVPLLIGNFIMALLLGALSYGIVYLVYYLTHYTQIEERKKQKAFKAESQK